MLHYTLHGPPSHDPPLLIAHGLFGSGRNWGVIAKRLSDRAQVIAVDMRNHGQSPWFDSHSYAEMAQDLRRVLEDCGVSRADVLGHSMGGKAAMMMALEHPQMVNRLIVADIAPVTYGHTQQGPIDAMRQVDLSQVERRSEASAQLADLGMGPMLQSFLTQSLDIPNKRWRFNLDVLADEMEKIIGFPEPQGDFDGPSLFLSGEASDYVTHEHRPIIKNLFPNAVFAKLPKAGHWLHAERPREFEAATRSFLDHTAL